VILSTRADRPLRTRSFVAWLAGRDDVDTVYVTGSHRHAARAMLRRHGLTVHDIGGRQMPLTVLDGPAAAPAGDCPVLVGIGNSRGLGLALRAGQPEKVS